MNQEAPVLTIGSSLAWGRVELYNDRVEFHLRTRHVTVPIDQISGVGTSGVGARKLQVFTRGETIEAEVTSMQDYMLLQEGIRRIKAGETLGPNQLRREQHVAVAQAGEELRQDENVRGCAMLLGILFAVIVVVGMVVAAVQWVFQAVGSLF